MKLTKQQLKRIIKEELENVLESQSNMFGRYGLDDWGDWGAKDGPRIAPKKKKTKTDPSTGEKKRTGVAKEGLYDVENPEQIDRALRDYYKDTDVARAVYELDDRMPEDIENYSQTLPQETPEEKGLVEFALMVADAMKSEDTSVY